MIKKTAIHWFRKDLRLADNPALCHAATCDQILPIYIIDPKEEMGQASSWWLHRALHALDKSLDGALNIYRGDPIEILQRLIHDFNISELHWNRCYEPYVIQRDKEIKAVLASPSLKVESHNGALLWEPWEVNKADGTPYKVFTPFYQKGCLNAQMPRDPLNKPAHLHCLKDTHALKADNIGLLPEVRWYKKLEKLWDVGEHAAQKQYQKFLENGLGNYKKGRDFPALKSVSYLSPYLHFGEISPNQLWHDARLDDSLDNAAHFRRELGWREFSYHLLYHYPDLPEKNFQPKFDGFVWDNNPASLIAWQKGRTGYPLIDAGMRELWQTGYMHNRVRMVVASFLIKNLRIDWRKGAAWFWDCLLDADLANNSASWQWVAGSGADAAPYFRIFNPILQSKKFDPEGEYISQFVPELKELPGKYLFTPWEAPAHILQKAGVKLGDNYPAPIVDLHSSRDDALLAYKNL